MLKPLHCLFLGLFFLVACNRTSSQVTDASLNESQLPDDYVPGTDVSIIKEPVPDKDGRITMPGTRVSIIPPVGFYTDLSPDKLKMYGGKGVYIDFDEEREAYDKDWHKSFTADMVNSTVVRNESLKVSGIAGHIFQTQEAGRTYFFLKFGTDSFSVSITAGCYTDSTTKKLADALQTVHYDVNRIVGDFETTAVVFDYKNTPFNRALFLEINSTYMFQPISREKALQIGHMNASVDLLPTKQSAEWMWKKNDWGIKDFNVTHTESGTLPGGERFFEQIIEGNSTVTHSHAIAYTFCATNGKRTVFVWSTYMDTYDEELVKLYRQFARTGRLKP
jgi:hypothetical protein